MNCHIFDGTLLHLAEETKSNIDIDTKLRLFKKVRKEIVTHNGATKCFNIIMDDIGKPSNFDNTNNLIADDIMYLICLKLDKDMLPIFIEQLNDMNTGLCPQGRCIRLAQIYQCLYTPPSIMDICKNIIDEIINEIISKL